jgi:hypothetical protein
MSGNPLKEAVYAPDHPSPQLGNTFPQAKKDPARAGSNNRD